MVLVLLGKPIPTSSLNHRKNMFKKKSELDKALQEIEDEIENKAWLEKKRLYGDKFNAPKFQDMRKFWPNFFSLIPLIIMIGIILYFNVPRFIKFMEEHEKMLSEHVEPSQP